MSYGEFFITFVTNPQVLFVWKSVGVMLFDFWNLLMARMVDSSRQAISNALVKVSGFIILNMDLISTFYPLVNTDM